jgi:hypothetical protein
MKSGFALLACALIAGSGLAYAQQEDPHALVKNLIIDTASDDEKLLGEVYTGELAQNEAAIFSVPINPDNMYMVYGACDFACGDIDLVILDTNGEVIDSDDGEDDVPMLSVIPDATGKQLNLRIEMQGCGQDKCIWALGIYEQL